MTSRDLYQILGVAPNASNDEIKKAYRRLARQYHPDSNKGDKAAEERFKEISEAYDILKDDKKRRQYDAVRQGGAFSQTGGGFKGGNPFSRAGGGQSFESFNDLGGGFSGIFESLFGGGAAESRMRRPRPGQDIPTTLDIPFEMAVRGGKQKITVRINEPVRGGGPPKVTTKDVTVKIPPGIRDGQKIRLPGAGQPGVFNGAPGSLLITIHVSPHAVFTREGADLYSTVTIDLPTAMLGGTVNVMTLEQTVTLKIPPGTQPGQKFKIRGQGGPKADGARGDHYATVEVRLPKRLDEGQIHLFKSFAETLKGTEY